MTPVNLSKKTVKRMQDMNMTPAELSVKTGIPANRIRMYLNGSAVLKDEEMEKICDCIGLPLETLVESQDRDSALQKLSACRAMVKQKNILTGIIMIIAGIAVQGISRLITGGKGFVSGVLVCIAVLLMIYGAEKIVQARGGSV